MPESTAAAEVDFFTSPVVGENPFEWFEQARENGPVWKEPHHGVYMVTGHEEIMAMAMKPEIFSSCVAVTGPFPGLNAEVHGDSAREAVEAARPSLPMNEYIVTLDEPNHTKQRALLMRLLTPRRLKENEDFIRRLCDEQLDTILELGEIELLKGYASPFALLVVADLLGVPEADHDNLRKQFGFNKPGEFGKEGEMAVNPLGFLQDEFISYIEDRRKSPRADVLTAMATTTYTDGGIPEVMDIVRCATFLFAAGQDTSARLICAAAKQLAVDKDLQAQLRKDPSKIDTLVEETLRLEGPVKTGFRLAMETTELGGVTIPAGSILAMALSAANRDPRRFECPAEFSMDRPDPYSHLAFGRGPHACPGGALARIEARITLERLLARTKDFSLAAEHGDPSNPEFKYAPTYILRGLSALYLTFTPADDEVSA